LREALQVVVLENLAPEVGYFYEVKKYVVIIDISFMENSLLVDQIHTGRNCTRQITEVEIN
jgi:hypothetical protein